MCRIFISLSLSLVFGNVEKHVLSRLISYIAYLANCPILIALMAGNDNSLYCILVASRKQTTAAGNTAVEDQTIGKYTLQVSKHHVSFSFLSNCNSQRSN